MSSRISLIKNLKSLAFLIGLVLVYYFLLLLLFSNGEPLLKVDFLFTGLFVGFMFIPLCTNLLILIPRFLNSEKYVLYLIGFIAVFFLSVLGWSRAFLPIVENTFIDYYFSGYLMQHNIYVVTGVILISSTLLSLTKQWFYLNRSEKKLLELENNRVSTQFNALRSQINPHFLFNSLNVIYSLSLDRKEQVTDAILHLSELLRHVIYETDGKSISLENELKLLKAYTEFQQYRIQRKDAVEMTVEIENYNFQIAPMLLLPLLENSFKHGLSLDKEPSKIFIKLKQKDNLFSFSIENNLIPTKTILTDSEGGVGLQSLKKSLELLYPHNHEFHISKDDHKFKVTLNLYDELQK
ncbi:MAG: histidine kinase [Nonlabens sp.]